MMRMGRRKLVKHGPSSLTVSLPLKWLKSHGLVAGDELDVLEHGNWLEIRTEKKAKEQVFTLSVDEYSAMLPRTIHALYKAGIDKLVLNFSDKKKIETIQNALGKEAVGYEILQQGENFCVVQNVTGDLEDFELVLRRTFRLLINQAEGAYRMLQSKAYDELKNLRALEESNNRFTTTCRRLINKRGYDNVNQIGPMYYILEELENIADELKYLCLYAESERPKRVSSQVLSQFSEVVDFLKLFYKLYYDFSSELLEKLGRRRKKIITGCLRLLKTKQGTDVVLLHHLLVLTQKVFALAGSCVILKAKPSSPVKKKRF